MKTQKNVKISNRLFKNIKYRMHKAEKENWHLKNINSNQKREINLYKKNFQSVLEAYSLWEIIKMRGYGKKSSIDSMDVVVSVAFIGVIITLGFTLYLLLACNV